MDEEPKPTSSKFNIAQLILFRINNGMERASHAYLTGDYRKWYFEWKNIKNIVIGKLEKEERKVLKELEVEIEKTKPGIKQLELIEEYQVNITDYLEAKEIGLVGKGDETIFS